MKRVLLLVVDALMGPLLLQELDNGRSPHFQMLRQAGVVREQCLSIFPSITHAALASLVTGKYPPNTAWLAPTGSTSKRKKSFTSAAALA